MVCLSAWVLLWQTSTTPAAECFITTTFGNTPACRHQQTLKVTRQALAFDVSVLRGRKIARAVLRVNPRGHRNGQAVRLVPIGLVPSNSLALRSPDYVSFDATTAVRAWARDASTNKGLKIEAAGGVRFGDAVLEVSYTGSARKPVAAVTNLQAVCRFGQVFITWREIEDPVGADRPTFADFEKAVLAARAKRRLVYRIYRHVKPITVASLGEAEIVREVPEALSAWNLLAVRNTEHPNQGTPTKRSELRPGRNLALNHVITRYRIAAGDAPLPRATALAVLTVTKPGKHYYAVTAAIDGCEAVAKLPAAASLRRPVVEKPGRFPSVVYQRTIRDDSKRDACSIDVYNSWLASPQANVPTRSETFIVRWGDLPKAGPDRRLPVMVTTGTHGGSATEMASLGWHRARRHIRGALTIGLTEGGLWQGFHECLGTLRGYGQGVVHNYPQRRVMSAVAWVLDRREPGLDPQRVYIWGQMAHWALRHGKVFAVVMSNGYGNPAIGKEAQKHGWKWGPYPKGSRNFMGVDQWEYMNLPRWIRRNPTVELPYWLCWPVYGAYPSHTIGDFGFMPWPEMIHAMATTKRAFAATWSTNGPGPAGPLRELAGRLRRDQSLPAFTNCSLDTSPGDGDHADADKSGGINLYQVWEPETVVDEPRRWEITLFLRPDCPQAKCTTDVTPRRCQKFKPAPGRQFQWTLTGVGDRKAIASGTAVADKLGLLTVKAVEITKPKRRLVIQPKQR